MDSSIIRQFDNREIRSIWLADEEEWYFSVVDVVGVLADSKDYQTARKYWNKLRQRISEEGGELVTNCHQLKMRAADGKMRKTDCATVQQLLRIIQSIPSKKAEPFKQWLAQVGAERIEETVDPQLAIDRALKTYLQKGYSPDWVYQRLMGIRIRDELTAEWCKRGVQPGQEYAILTDDIYRAWSNMSAQEYKELKGLTKENLRDNMSDTEAILSMLAENAAKLISQAEQPEGLDQNRDVAQRGGAVAGVARKAMEAETGRPVVTSMKAVDFARLIGQIAADVGQASGLEGE